MPGTLRVADVEALASIWAAPDSRLAGRDELRGQGIWEAITASASGEPRVFRVRMFLEAVRPTRANALGEQAASAMALAGFTSKALKRAVQGLLEVSADLEDPVDLLKLHSSPSGA